MIQVNYDGGMVILECKNIEEARAIAESDPFIEKGYKTFELRTLSIANKENNYGLSMDQKESLQKHLYLDLGRKLNIRKKKLTK